MEEPMAKPLDPKMLIYPHDSCAIHFVWCAAGFAAIALIVTLILMWSAWKDKDNSSLIICLGCWAIGSPFWFWLDYFWLYRTYGEIGSLELFKQGQQVAAAIWAGVTALLLGFLAYNKEPDTDLKATQAQIKKLEARIAQLEKKI